MPYYQFIVQVASATARRKAEVAAAVTKAHVAVTGAPADYVNCVFVEVPADSIFVGDRAGGGGRLFGVIRRGRSEETRRRLIEQLATAWSEASGDPKENLAVFLAETPGFQVMEKGAILPEAWQDQGHRGPAD